MKICRVLIVTLSTAVLFLMSGCILEKLSTVDYNNEMVEHLNPTLDAMEASLDTYENTVPVTVAADTVIDTTPLLTTYEQAKLQIENISKNLLPLQSWNSEQQTGVQDALKDYEKAANDYLGKYKEMLDYYTGDFAANLEVASTFGTELYELYNDYIEAHNALVEALASYT